MSSSAQERRVRSGEVIFRQGEAGRTAFLIQSGSVQIVRSDAGQDVTLADRGAGEIIGEMALFGRPRTATATATVATSLSVIQEADLLGEAPGPRDRVLLRAVMRRYGDALARMEEDSRQILAAGAHLDAAAEAVGESARATASFSADFGRIADVCRRISEISMRTEILSVNASVEAARAGPAGVGFAVVADEVRMLAEQAKRDTGEIGALLGTLTGMLQSAQTQVGAAEVEIATSREASQKCRGLWR